MAEYIEREAVIHRIRKVATMIGFENPAVAIDSAITVIERAPTADVAPVVHGRWVDRIVDENEVIQPWMKRYYCSECLECGNQSWFKFCPNCGAKMDLEG